MNLSEKLPKSQIGKYISEQLIRSGTSPALNYGEAKGAESSNDFIHKMKVCLKELRETFISLKIIKAKPLIPTDDSLIRCLNECNELISIFVKSIRTAETNRKNK
ncbi:MAG: four helix bundle protein [Bacteroidales bacterium]|nr:four helix bundle protein [Bacteroidales bacterium]